MPHNPSPVEGRFFASRSSPGQALPDHRVIALQGRDASAFAQAQFMNDVSALQPGHWQWNGWLTAKGRVIALFALLKFDAETLWLLLPDADPQPLVESLRRFVFRSKVEIVPRDDLQVTGAFVAPRAADGTLFAGDPVAGVELDFGGDDGARTLRIAAEAGVCVDADACARWTAFDLLHGLPRLAAMPAAQWTPQQLSLGRLRAYSVRKGCYPGQEIVARTHFLGQSKRELVLLEGHAPMASGDEVHNAAVAMLGTVVSGSRDGDRHIALAVVPLEREGQLSVGGTQVSERLLLRGLAR